MAPVVGWKRGPTSAPDHKIEADSNMSEDSEKQPASQIPPKPQLLVSGTGEFSSGDPPPLKSSHGQGLSWTFQRRRLKR